MSTPNDPLSKTIRTYNRSWLKIVHWIVFTLVVCGVASFWGWGWGAGAFFGILLVEVLFFQ